jgi:hypothetical protein
MDVAIIIFCVCVCVCALWFGAASHFLRFPHILFNEKNEQTVVELWRTKAINKSAMLWLKKIQYRHEYR